MNITCQHCKTKLNLPDDKIPKDRDSSFKCPKCKESIHIKAPVGREKPIQDPGPVSGSGRQGKALVCMSPSLARNRIMAGIQKAGFLAEVPESQAQAFQQLEYHIYPLVVVDDAFDSDNQMAVHMNDLDMSLRRRICLVRISPGGGTGNAMAALHSSVNYVIQTRDLEQEDESLVENILATAMTDHENFYRVYNDSMKAVGKA